MQSDLERFIAESSSAQVPSEEEARKTYAEAMDAVKTARVPVDEAAALRRLAKAATALARVLSR